jgi:hypothetical protein
LPRESFDFPLGIRLWPNEPRSRRLRLKEGYSFSLLENCTDSYRFTVMAGAGKISRVFRSFAQALPAEAFLILEYYPEENQGGEDEQPVPTVFYSPYYSTEEILSVLESFLPRLIHDGFVGFGLANNRAGMELFYSEEKVLTVFTGNHIRIMDLLARHGLRHNPDLFFPADSGHDHLSLLCHPEGTLPEPFASMAERDLDYVHFCNDLVEQLEMYPVEENISFFLSKRDQDLIETRLREHAEFAEFAEEDFGSLLLDWIDFVGECETAFEGDLWEYRQCLKLRDMIQYVVEGMPAALAGKLLDIVAEADGRLRKNLVDSRKRLDPPSDLPLPEDRFWYLGMVRNPGADLRRDLIRQGWFKP